MVVWSRIGLGRVVGGRSSVFVGVCGGGEGVEGEVVFYVHEIKIRR